MTTATTNGHRTAELTPPHDPLAEKTLLGFVLTAGRIPEPAADLKPDDFYQPAHTLTWQVAVELTRQGATPDLPAVVSRLTETGRLHRAGGAGYLASLLAPPPADSAQLVAVIRDRAGRRRLIQAAETITAKAYRSSAPFIDQVEAAETLLAGTVTDDTDDLTTLLPLEDFVARDLGPQQWVIPGILERRERLIFTGHESLGKALALDTPIPTPDGWTLMGNLKVGDQVYGSDGNPTNVTAATPVLHGRRCYKVVFSDRSEIVADGSHQWLTHTSATRERKYRTHPLQPRGTDQTHLRRHLPEVVTTEHILDTLTARDGHVNNHAVPTCAPLQNTPADLPVDPYVLGAWLGDGTSANAQITCHDDDAAILDRIRDAGFTVTRASNPMAWLISRREQRQAARERVAELVAAGASQRAALRAVGIDRRVGAEVPPITSLQEDLRNLGVLNNKHIPSVYLRASFAQRLHLLQGLMDTDGTIGDQSPSPIIEFAVTSERLAYGALELIRTFGIKCRMKVNDVRLNGRYIGPRYRITFHTALPIFSLPRKRARLRVLTKRHQFRYITAVDPVEPVPVRCIQVDAPDHLYLAGESMIPTHNSTLVRQLAVCAAAGMDPFLVGRHSSNPQSVLFVDCENPDRLMLDRFAALKKAVAAHGYPVPYPGLWIERREQGMDLFDPADRRWLQRRIDAVRPDVLFIGALYKMFRGDSNDERVIIDVVRVLDEIRVRNDVALVMEHHQAKGGSGDRHRPVSPVGSSVWLRWVDSGYGLRPVERPDVPVVQQERDRLAELVPWKKRDERRMPRFVKSGGEFMPWVETDEEGR